MPEVHSSSIVSESARLADDVVVGPFCVIEGDVSIGAGTVLQSHNVIRGPVEIGSGCTVFPFATVGLGPQHLAHKPEDEVGGVKIGDRVTLRESSTVHQAWLTEAPTALGDECYVMAGAHIGHDSVLGKNCIVCNAAQVSGHSIIGDRVYISGLVGIHQFVAVGRLAMFSGGTAISKDLPPFCICAERNMMGGVNVVGMRRAGIDRAEISAVRKAYTHAFRQGLTGEALQDKLAEFAKDSACVGEMLEFVKTSKRGTCPADGRPRGMVRSWLRRTLRASGVQPGGDLELAEADSEMD
ncbi:MAG: acyl-ACP--UDP-N-acetylglucosamine O-acyltransferase [Planctomycetota bacterium]